MGLIDAHVHTGDHLLNVKEFIKRGELRVAINSTSSQDAAEVLRLKREMSEAIFAFIGLHPNSEQSDISEVLKLITAQSELIDGVGEIGLDRRVEGQSVIENFRQQLEMAERLSKPVNLHSRGRLKDIIEILDSYRLQGVLFHWFDGTDSELTRVCDKGYFVGFGPASVYSKRLQKLMIKCPLENILTESDAPVRYSGCFEGAETDSRFISSVVFSISFLKKSDAVEIEKEIELNFSRYIKRPIHQ
ncbi:MAG: TatD family hydrolase [Conexivisphaerales archaeon]